MLEFCEWSVHCPSYKAGYRCLRASHPELLTELLLDHYIQYFEMASSSNTTKTITSAGKTITQAVHILKLRQDDFCWREPHIPNVIGATDIGTSERVRNFCSLSKIVSDDFIPPPYMFDYAMARVVKPVRSEFSDIPVHEVATIFSLPPYVHHCRYVPCTSSGGGGRIAIGVCKRSLNHIMNHHSVCNDSTESYATDRVRHCFQIGVGKGVEKSAFIDRSLVLPLILSTIQNPDKITRLPNSDRFSLDRLFDVEIGHTFEKCCYITRVIVKKVSKVTPNIRPRHDTTYYEISSAYPVSQYYAKYM